ncbi:uridine kinase [Motiliproteus sp. MSK22-1]|uniref:uridine kinase n=1 Tax=Motiliproteus sp. MSK22-1 TaxID=1897630 RepID=UPI0009766FD9|nr:uridine kinase [Motiliproteus sp. MSK22-1]OMH36203.1 uridine kinase [Motiliproteus sp. MSK22-1]
MEQSKIYDQLATELMKKIDQLEDNSQYWIGLAGVPGSGKSTIAAELKHRLESLLTIIPMDGYHYYRHELDQMDDPKLAHARRGAPFTFNAKRFVADLTEAKKLGTGTFPDFDHNVGDPIEGAITLTTKTPQIVLVEGNYLLLDDSPWCLLKEQVFDETWLLYVPHAESHRRVYQRHLTTGLTENQARFRVEQNDSPNAELITTASTKNANRIIKID